MLKKVLLSAVAGLAILAAPAAAAEPAERFNAPGQRHVNVCARPASPLAQLRYGDAGPTGFTLDDKRTFDDGRCPPATLRLDLHELIPSTSGPLAFHRGGNGYADDQNVKYGELATADVVAAELPAPVLSRGGRGAPCGLAAGQPPYRVQVRSIDRELHYKRPQDVASGSNSGSSFLHYGDPGADQGDRDDIHYSYLLWSFVNVRGGGIVRTLLKDDQVVRLCDVEPVTMDAWDRAGVVNGRVTARYVRINAGSCPLYGWMVWAHDEFADATGEIAHARVATGAVPADPAPALDCPVQESAMAPAVATGEATGVGETTATLAGTIDPAGVVGSYRFEFGQGSEYGTSTPAVELAPDIAPRPVTAAVAGLQPSTTYHYRVVATTTHGTSYGQDMVLTTASPPPVERPVEPAAPPPPPPPAVELTDLRLSPSSFRRARSRTGRTARIRWTASGYAEVTLTFERRTLGMRVGAACKAPPRAGMPRRAKRCTRWVRTGGTLRQAPAEGRTAMAFGGWVGKRPLARGSYRVRALPVGDDGRAGKARYAAFTLR